MTSTATEIAYSSKPAAKATSPPPSHPFWCSARMTYTLCAFFAMVLHLCMRNTMNFIILCMVKHDPEATALRSVHLAAESECTIPNQNLTSVLLARHGDIAWTRSEEFTVLGTFYYGYLLSLPLGGRLADKFGGKTLFVHSLTAQAIVFMLMPVFAHINFEAIVVIRVLQGLIAGCGNPAIYQLFTVWAHPTERTNLMSFAYGGYSVGSLIVFPLSSFICRISWEYAFYVVGSVSLLFGICCNFLVYSTLQAHPRLSPAELEYLKADETDKNEVQDGRQQSGVPWKLIFTSLPVYAFALTHVCHTYGLIMITQVLPMFFSEALRFSMDQVGWLSAAPFLGALLSKIITVSSCGYFEKRQTSGLTNFRRYVYVATNLATILCMGGIILASCNDKYVIVLLTLGIGFFLDLGFAGAYWPSCICIAPAYSGLISGLSNCLATVSGFLGPLITDLIVQNGTKSEWNNIWLTLIVSFSLAAFVYGIFGSSKLQSWGRGSTVEVIALNELNK